ncbi:MAG: ABC transporter substrate-binding protein [Synergistaceae bacterium]|jgi:branched-chain amino acid transport system substrate-binding protein|nr:ABC transporter substrate-binding protein [Synergistaceae bacterium]
MKVGKAVLVTLVFLSCLQSVPAWSAEEPIRIGYLAALTGDAAVWGQAEQGGARLYVKQINEKGGLLGRPVELVCYDTRGKPEDALNAVKRMIFEDKVVAIGGSNFSSIQLAIASVVDQNKIPAVASAATNPTVTVDPETGKVRPYMFRIAYTDPYQGKVIADYLIEKCGAKKIAILGDIGSAYSEGLTEFLRKRASELGAEHKFWAFREGDVDFRAQITEARNWGAEAVALTMLYKEMGLVIKQAVEAGWKPQFMGGDGVSPNIFEIAGNEGMEGTFWVQAMSFTDPKVIALNQVYEKEFGEKATEPTNLVAGYDIMTFIGNAISVAGKTDGPAIAEAMENTKGLEVTHFTWTVDKETHNPLNKPAAVLTGKGGELVFVEYWAPQDTANQ